MSLQGTLQIVVSLKSPSVEYSGETGDNRFSRTLGSDTMAASDILTKAKNHPDAAGMEDTQVLEYTFNAVSELIDQLGSLTSFTLTRGGNKVVIRAEDISFITLKTDGAFRDIQDAAE